MQSRLTKSDFQRELGAELNRATSDGFKHLDVRSGNLHTTVGLYPGPRHAMPTCCNVMYEEMKLGDDVLQAPPKGKGANLVIRYLLPR